MNIYYTAKDIEELAAKGTKQLAIGPGVFLTDFARETAQQMDITLVEGGGQASVSTPPTSPSTKTTASDKYNKPAGCQHASSSLPAAPAAQSAGDKMQSYPTLEGAGSNTVNKLIDLMGKAIKRGG